jgi:F-type H+-transporting ATPase subunit alpha
VLDIPTDRILDFQQALFDLIDTKYPKIPETIKSTKVLDDETEKALVDAIQECKKSFK